MIVARDTTERDRSGEHLSYLVPLVEEIDDAVIALDGGRRVVMWNRGAERMYGWSVDEMLGKHLPSLLRMDMREEEPTAVRQQLSERGRWRGEASVTRRDGSTVWVEAVNIGIRDAHGEITGYLGIHRDIGERKRAEQRSQYHASLLDNIEDGVIATDAEDFRIVAWNRGAVRLYGFSVDDVLGREARDVASYPGDESRQRLEAELLETGRTRIEFTAVCKDGSPVEVELIAVAVEDDWGATTGYSGIRRDISERRRAQAELGQTLRQQAAVAELGLAALATDDLQSVLDRAAHVVASTLDVEYAGINELLADRERLLVSAGAGWPVGIVGSATLPAGRGSPAGYALLMREPVIVDDMSAETRFEVPALLRESAVLSEIIVVIGLVGNPFGTLTALSKTRRTFSEHDVSFMQSVANVLATVAGRSQEDERLEAARKAERGRISRELHDGGLRELTEALGIATLARSSSSEPRDEQRWAALTATLQRLGQQLRSAIYDLRLGTHEDRLFADLLDDLVAVQSELAVRCQVQLHGREHLPERSLAHRGTEVLRIVREAITNARLHSGAATIRVDASRSTAELLRLTVSDDGDWPDREAAISARRGTGILGMTERAAELGAALRIEAEPGGGTSVSLELPLTG